MQTADWLQTIIVFRIRQQWDYCCHLLICMAKTTVRSLYHTQAYGKARIRNRSRKRNRIRNRNRKRNPNLRNKTWRRFCLTIIAQSRLFIPTLYLFIVHVIIFFTVAFLAYGAKFSFENFIYVWALQLGIMIDMSTPPPFAAFSSQWMKHGALLRNE